jgi:DNA-binding NtrC family response regulator
MRAFDYLTKPVDLEDVRQIVNRAAARAIANREARRLTERLREAVHFENIVAASPVMHRVLRIVRQIAPTKITALIIGETGTGKELIAHAIHANSTRRNKPYKVINCAGLPRRGRGHADDHAGESAAGPGKR